MRQAAVGFRVHSGWAAAVTVADNRKSPEVVDRRRIKIADDAPGSKQPYHFVERLPLDRAAAVLQSCRETTLLLAEDELASILHACPVRACAILQAAGRPLPELAAILASHALIHTAEGEFFRQAIADASRKRGLSVRVIRERDLLTICAAELKLGRDELDESLADWGRALGPPWRQDEKFAALAAWLALPR